MLRELADLADRTGVEFDAIVRRYENGVRGEALLGKRIPTDEWLTTPQVAERLGIRVGSICTPEFRDAVQHVSRSFKPGASGRGVGFLWRASQVESIRCVMHEMQVSVTVAARLVAAVRSGRVQILGSDR